MVSPNYKFVGRKIQLGAQTFDQDAWKPTESKKNRNWKPSRSNVMLQ
jgi:hypothetical protein